MKRTRFIACEILARESARCVSRSTQTVDLTLLPKRLHDIGEAQMSKALQEEIDRTDESVYDRICLGYGLCNNGVRGLTAKLPMVLPRGHDCITLLLGSRKAYDDLFSSRPGTIYRSPGWIERDDGLDPGRPDNLYAEYLEKYGEENARYLAETLGGWTKNYTHLVYIDTAVVPSETFKEKARQEAEKNGWTFEIIQGNTSLLQDLLDGTGNPADFLIIPPGAKIEASIGPDIVRCTACLSS
jgi:hypothetical protein